MPFISCILLSHNKPDHVVEAIDSLLAQTFRNWEAVVFDSGVLYDQGFFSRLPAMKDPRIRLVRSWETEQLRQTKTIASWCFNECFRKKMLNGSFVVYLCDDDMFYPNAFATFHDYAQAHPEAKAMYASVDLTGVSATGEKQLFRELHAQEVKGSCCGGGPLDCQVDYLQFCHRAELFNLFPDGEFWPEDREVIRHADGIFLEKIGSRTPIYPISVKIGENRKLPDSLNTGGERLELMLEITRRDREIQRLSQLLAQKERESAVSVSLRYQIADKVNDALKRIPGLHLVGKRLVLTSWQLWKQAARRSA
jgi:glycosyltransferase involved in cell wall biosynthesis